MCLAINEKNPPIKNVIPKKSPASAKFISLVANASAKEPKPS
jgi:ABC-type Fe3+ transport system substrate-binding protein